MSIEGRRIGEYVVGPRLGVGGMAEVFAAERRGPAGFRRPVALKVLRPHLRTVDAVVERFTREARFAAALQHPNLVPVLDVAVDGDVVYLAMELVDGPDLRRATRAGVEAHRPLPWDLVVHVGIQVCRGLAHAHRQAGLDGRPLGLVHRDISPQNILVSRSGEVRLTDFGIATALHAEESRTGALRGKLAYLAPEQVDGRPADCRADLFALGVVLWELLAGRRLFLAATDAETLANVRRCDVPLPPVPTPADVGEPVWGALAGALGRDRARRYAEADAMADALAAACPEAARLDAVRRLAQWVSAVVPPSPPWGVPTRGAGTPMEEPGPAPDAAAPGLTPTRLTPSVAPDSSTPPLRIGAGQRPDPASRRPHRSRALVALAGAVLLAAITLALVSRVVERGLRGPTPPPAPVASAAAQPTAAATPAAPRAHPEHAPPASTHRAGEGRAQPATRAERRGANSQAGALIVTSQPAGAGILLDGRPAGTTPKRIGGLPPSEPVLLRLQLDGFRPIERTVTPAAGALTTVDAALEPAFATLSVDADPWAEVWVDGRRFGSTPLFERRVPAGRRTVRLVHPPTGRAAEFVIDLSPDEAFARRVALAPAGPDPRQAPGEASAPLER